MQFPNFKKNRKGSREAGFIQLILLIVGALVLLKYVYNVDVVGFLTTGKPKELLDQFYSLATRGWEKYDNIMITIWNYFVSFIKNILVKLK